MSHRQNHFGSTIKTVLNDEIEWDNTKLPLRGCGKDPTQLRRCRKHKRIEATYLLSLPHGSSFLDCGSHFGDTVLTMAIHARVHGRDDLRFIAFEPCRRKCKFIRSMVKLNNLQERVKIINSCVGDCDRLVSQVEQERNFAKYDGRTAYRAVSKELGSLVKEDTHIDLGGSDSKPSLFYYNGDLGFDDKLYNPESGSESDSSEEDTNHLSSLPMISLDSIKSQIMPLGLLHLDVEGWEAQALKGATSILKESNHTCFIICEVWDEKDRRRRQKALENRVTLETDVNSDGRLSVDDYEMSPEDEIVSIMAQYKQFYRHDDIVDQDRNLVFSTSQSHYFNSTNKI